MDLILIAMQFAGDVVIGLEQLVRNDLTQQVAAAIDLACINGSGSSNQPTGI